MVSGHITHIALAQSASSAIALQPNIAVTGILGSCRSGIADRCRRLKPSELLEQPDVLVEIF